MILVTLYQTVVGEEGQVEMQYVVWLRALLFIGLFHLLFARQKARHGPGQMAGDDSRANLPAGAAPVFGNLMR